MTDALKIIKLCKTYPGGIKALCGINLSVKRGDFYAFLGPNGSGKSTTIGIISSLINKSSGEVKIFGYDIDHNIIQAKRQIGLVPQEFNFNPFETVTQIIVNQAGYYGVNKKKALLRTEKYLNKLNLWKNRNDPARMLSGGMKRRLMIARALIHKPNLLILDEPTTGIDIELRRSMWNFFKELNSKKGITIILTTHYLEEAEHLCRNICIIKNGKLLENTSIKKLFNKLKSEIFIFDIFPPIHDKNNFYLYGYNSRIINESTLEVEVNRKQGLNEIFNQLNYKKILVLSMKNKINRLEKLFIKLLKKH